MRILLIDPPFKRFTGFIHRYYPLELAYIAATIKAHGFEDVAIFDADVINRGDDIDFSDEYQRLKVFVHGLNDKNHPAWGEMKAVLDESKPDIACISASVTRFGSVMKTAELIKEYYPDCVVVVEGQYPTLRPDDPFKCKYIDMAIRGQSETAFLRLVCSLRDGLEFEDIPGLSYRRNGRNGEIIHNPDTVTPENIDILPAREALIDIDSYTGEDMGMMVTSRGCPFRCAFCALVWNGRLSNQSTVQHRSIDSVIEEIKFVRDRFNTTQFIFYDNSFGVSKENTVELCERIIKEGLNVNWSCATRVNLIDEKVVKLMKQAGCNLIKIGIESGSERVLGIIQKGISIDLIQRAANKLNKSGIFWGAYFMMGLPIETEEDMKATHALMKRINPPHAGIFLYTPYPSTRLFEMGVEAGIYHEDMEIDQFLTRHPRDYFLVDPQRRTADIEPERFQQISRELLSKFYWHNVRFGSIFRQFLSRRRMYLRNGKSLWSDILKGIRWILKRV
ncbi:radical SAM protein [Candidatus Desantisbacteria bacterium]|nr:radical SAM protein [Candidatus Desantisbacteria bacterium]